MTEIEGVKRGIRIILLMFSFVFVIILLFIFVFFSQIFYLTPSYEKSIEREYSSQDEERAINISEEIDYADTFDIEKFYNPNDSDRCWPNVIDRDVIEFYSDRVSKLENQSRRVRVKLEYIVNSTHFSKAEINVSSSRIKMKMDYDDDRRVVFEDPDNVVHFGIKYMNNSSILETIEPMDFTFNSSGYLVDMSFNYWESTGPKVGYSKELRQVVVLGEEWTVKFIVLVDLGNKIF